MEHVDYVYTSGMSESDVEERLREGNHGVLGLADTNDAYVVPLSYHYDGERVLVRVSEQADDSEKKQYLETTENATFVCYDASSEESWSIHIRGQVSEWDGDVDEATLNEWFPPFRLFDESVENVEFSLYELEMDAVTGRKTV